MRRVTRLWAWLAMVALLMQALGCSSGASPALSKQTGSPASGAADKPGPAQSAAKSEPAKAAPQAEAKPAPKTPAGPPVKVRIAGAVEALVWAPLYVAMHKGYLKDEGLDVEWSIIRGGPNQLAAVAKGDVDMVASGVSTQLAAYAKGQDVLNFYVFSRQIQFLAVSKRFIEQRGVDVNAPFKERIGKLKGITLGAPSLGGVTEAFSRYIMRKGGLQDADVSVVQAGTGAALVAALENNQIDGFLESPPGPQQASLRGKAVVLVTPRDIVDFDNYYHVGMFTSHAYAQKNPEVLKKVAAAIDRGKRLIRDDLESAVAAVKKQFPQMDEAALREGLKAIQDAFGTDGRMTEAGWRGTLNVLREVEEAIKGLGSNVDLSEGKFWSNKYLP